MKTATKLLFFLSMAILAVSCQNKAPSDKADGMAQFADDEEFKESHELPREAEATRMGEMTTFPVEGGEDGRAFELRPESDPQALLLVIHEWWGLNDNIKMEAQKLFDSLDNVHVLALDLYDGKVAETRDDASSYMQSVSGERANAIIGGALAYGADSGPVGTIGWCFGGGWSLKSAIQAGERADACVIYYGMPVQKANELAPLDAPILGIFAEQDGHITPEVVRQFDNLCKATGKEFEYHMYDAAHAFANPSGDRYDEDAAQDANRKALAFLREKLTN